MRRRRRCAVSRPSLTVAALVGLLILAAGCGGGGASTPASAIQRLRDAAADRDYGAIYDLFSTRMRLRVDAAIARVLGSVTDEASAQRLFGTSLERLPQLNERERFIAMAEAGASGERLAADAQDLELARAGQPRIIKTGAAGEAGEDGDVTRAIVTLTYPGGREDEIELVLEKDGWHLDTTAICGVTPGGRSALAPLALLALLLAAWSARRRLRRSPRPTPPRGG